MEPVQETLKTASIKMEQFLSLRKEREAKFQEKLDAYHKAAKALDEEWKKVEEGHANLQARKEALAKENGGCIVSDLDMLDINAGGQIFRVCRSILTQIEGSHLEALFSGRWEKQLQRDHKRRIFLDINPICFKSTVDYLIELGNSPPDDPPEGPFVEPENQVFLDGLLTAFGLEGSSYLDSSIVSDPKHATAINQLLSEDKLGTGLTLLYRGSRDGMNARSFHQKCDNQGPTITFAKSSSNHIFGGYTDQPWSSTGGWVQSKKSFLFGLSCHEGKSPVKMHPSRPQQEPACIFCDRDDGPSFGSASQGNDLALLDKNCTFGALSHLGGVYARPPRASPSYFTGSNYFSISEIEVYRIDSNHRKLKVLVQSNDQQSTQVVAPGSFPEDACLSIEAEEEALASATDKLLELQDSFEKERTAVQVFCGSHDDKIALLNVSGVTMAVKHSTLAMCKESVLYKHFVDENWNGKNNKKLASDWGEDDVVAWAKEIHGLKEDVSCYFQDVGVSELLAMNREDIKDLGIHRPGSVAIITNAIQKLREEHNRDSVMLINHSGYCFGKIIDQLRLKAMGPLGVPNPSPPEIREPDRKRFKRTVEYYFPTEEGANQFLG